MLDIMFMIIFYVNTSTVKSALFMAKLFFLGSDLNVNMHLSSYVYVYTNL